MIFLLFFTNFSYISSLQIPEQYVRSVKINSKDIGKTLLMSLTSFWCLYC